MLRLLADVNFNGDIVRELLKAVAIRQNGLGSSSICHSDISSRKRCAPANPGQCVLHFPPPSLTAQSANGLVASRCA